MKDEGKISPAQLRALMIITILGTTLLFMPSLVVAAAKQDGWLSMIVGVTGGYLEAAVVLALAKRFPNQSMVEYSEAILGKFLGKIMGLAIILYLIGFDLIIVREFGELLVLAIMPATPITVFIVVILLLAVYASTGGLEVIARENTVFFGPIMAITLSLFILAARDYDFGNLLPVMENGPMPVLKGALPTIAFFGEIGLVGFLYPKIKNPEQIPKATYQALAVAGGVMLLDTIAVLAIFNPENAARLVLPTLDIAKNIRIAQFIEHMEALVAFIWISAVFIKITIFLYVAALATNQWLGLDRQRLLNWPLAGILAPLAIFLFPSSLALAKFIEKAGFPILYAGELGIPLLLLIVAAIRGKKEATSHEKAQ